MDYIFNLLNHYGLWLGFVLVGIENIGVPFPIEFVYLYCANLIDAGKVSFLLMVLYFTLGHVAGSIISYYFGYVGNNAVSHYFANRKSLVSARDKIEKWYSRYGSATNLITRLIGYVRPWSSMVAGFGKENFWAFLGYSTLGTIIFNILALYFARAILFFWDSIPYAKYIIIVGFIFFFAGVWFFYPLISRKMKS